MICTQRRVVIGELLVPAYGRVLGQRDYAGRRYKFAGYYDVIILREMILER